MRQGLADAVDLVVVARIREREPALVTSYINCVSPGGLSATLAVILIGAGIAWTAERRKLARVRSGK